MSTDLKKIKSVLAKLIKLTQANTFMIKYLWIDR